MRNAPLEFWWKRLLKNLSRPGLEVLSDIQSGYPKKAIPDFAREWKADLVMVGSRGLGAVSRFFLGSVAQAVLRSAPCSVEIVRSASADSPASSHAMKILLATDGSECSEIAVRSVANRPWPAGSEIKIISVRELLTLENATTVSSPCPIYPESLLNEILEDARKRCRQSHRPCATRFDLKRTKSVRWSGHTGRGRTCDPAG